MPILDRETNICPLDLLDGHLSTPPNSSNNDADDQQRRWWAIYTRSRAEKALARNLESSRIPFFLPLVAKDQFIRGRRKKSYLPLFNGYLFLFGSEAERTRMFASNHARISRMLEVDDQQRLLVDLRQINLLIKTEAPLTVESRLTEGQIVRVKQGVLKGLEGSIIRRQNTHRLVVAVNYLQQGVSVEIDDFMVEPL